MQDGTSVWWQVQSRNKRSIALDLRSAEGQEIARSLVAEADVLIENFRPGTLEGWGLGCDALSPINPGAGHAAHLGLRPDRARTATCRASARSARRWAGCAISPASRAACRCAAASRSATRSPRCTAPSACCIALYHRKVNGGAGQVIDVALHEAVFNMMESLIPEYSAFGAVREPAGSALPGIAPSNAYRCVDGVRAHGGQRRQHLQAADAGDRPRRPGEREPASASNAGRVARVDELDAAIGAWAAVAHGRPRCSRRCGEARVPAGKVYTAKDIDEDPHYRARDMILRQRTRDGHELEVPGIVPKLLGHAGHGARLGAQAGRRHRCGAGRDRPRRGRHRRPARPREVVA